MDIKNNRIVFKIDTNEATPFNVRLVRLGEVYGLHDKLVHDKEEPLVEFFDKRYPHTENGQFVSRYYLSTIMNSKNKGLCLDGEIKDWVISEKGMNFVLEKLNELIPYEVNLCANTEKSANKVRMR